MSAPHINLSFVLSVRDKIIKVDRHLTMFWQK